VCALHVWCCLLNVWCCLLNVIHAFYTIYLSVSVCASYVQTDVSMYISTSFVNSAIEPVVLPSLQGHSWAAVAAPCEWVEEPAWDSQQPVEGEEQEHEVSLLQAPHFSPSPPACWYECTQPVGRSVLGGNYWKPSSLFLPSPSMYVYKHWVCSYVYVCVC